MLRIDVLNLAKLPKRLKRTKVYGSLVKSKCFKKNLLYCIKHLYGSLVKRECCKNIFL